VLFFNKVERDSPVKPTGLIGSRSRKVVHKPIAGAEPALVAGILCKGSLPATDLSQLT